MLNNDIVGFYESQFETYDEVNSHFKIYYLEFSRWIKKNLNEKHTLIADLGCGTGTLSKLLTERDHFVYGIDVSSKLIKVAISKSHKNFSPLISDISNLPIKNTSFDGIISFGVLDQVEQIEQVVDEAARVLKPGGLFLFDISPFPTLDFWYFFGLYGRRGFASAIKGLLENQTKFVWSIKGDDGKAKSINIYRYKPSYVEKMMSSKGFRVIGKRGFHLSKMFIPEKVHVDNKTKILSKIDFAFWKFDNYLNRFYMLQKNSLYLMYAFMKV